MCGGSEVGLYLRPIDFVYLSTLGLRAIKKKNTVGIRGVRCAISNPRTVSGLGFRLDRV